MYVDEESNREAGERHGQRQADRHSNQARARIVSEQRPQDASRLLAEDHLDTGLRRCCTNRHGPARGPPTGFLPADAIRHWSAEGGHPIQDLTAENDLTPLSS